jgi:hypothetical protein
MLHKRNDDGDAQYQPCFEKIRNMSKKYAQSAMAILDDYPDDPICNASTL